MMAPLHRARLANLRAEIRRVVEAHQAIQDDISAHTSAVQAERDKKAAGERRAEQLKLPGMPSHGNV